MLMFFYLLGVAIVIVVLWVAYKDEENLSKEDLIDIITSSMFSWIALVALLITLWILNNDHFRTRR